VAATIIKMADVEPLLAVTGLLAAFARPWWVAGGWAIDALAGGPIRRHDDIEIGLLRPDLPALGQHLRQRGWRLEHFAAAPPGSAGGAAGGAAGAGSWVPLASGETVPRPHFQLRARAAGAPAPGHVLPSEFELFLNDLETDRPGARWVSRRHPTVAVPLAELIVIAPRLGIPVLAPEVQLLYKAKYHRPKDEHDFTRALPLLTSAQCSWLARALGGG